MNWKKDKEGNLFTSQAGAADYVGMARSSFQYLYKGTLNEQFKPKYKIYFGKQIYWKTDLDEWKNKTANIKFSYKKRQKKQPKENTKLPKLSNVTKFPNQTK
jgi:hypothetical protein